MTKPSGQYPYASFGGNTGCLLVQPAFHLEVFNHSQQLFPLGKVKSSFLCHVTGAVSGFELKNHK